jgi:hypothetical protein
MELHKGALCEAPRNIVTALTTTMADVSAGKTANTHMYAKSVAGVILRDCADNHIKERVNQSLTLGPKVNYHNHVRAIRAIRDHIYKQPHHMICGLDSELYPHIS